MAKVKNSTWAFVLIALLSVGIGVFTQQSSIPSNELPELEKAIILPKTKTLSGINFTDHNGQVFDRSRLLGHWSILFFGFTNCPDICPTTMQTLKNVKQNLVEQGLWGNYQVVMVSVDPERDTPEQLSNYVPYFDPEFIGVSSDLQSTTDFAKQVGVLFVAHEVEGSDNYDVDHSAALILLNPQAEWAGAISAPHKVDEISADLAALAKHFAADHQTALEKPIVAATTAPKQESNTNNDLSQASLVISDAWIRPAPPTVSSMAAYFVVSNNTDQDISIVDSDSPSFDMTMIHDTIIEDGIAKMQHRDDLVVPANGSVTLAPMSTHMMLMRPEQPLPVGSKVEISLITNNDQVFNATIEVKPQPGGE